MDVAAAERVSGVVCAAGCGSYLRPGGSHAPDAPGGLWQRPRRLRCHGNRCGRGRCAALHEEPLSKSRLASVSLIYLTMYHLTSVSRCVCAMFTVPQTIITDDVVGGERDTTSLYHSDVMSLGLIWSLEKHS